MIQKYKYTILLQFCRPTWYCVCAIEEYLSNTKKNKKNTICSCVYAYCADLISTHFLALSHLSNFYLVT